MADNSARVGYLDELKGLAVFLVVLGHLVTGRGEYRRIYNFIYSFHMPLFMFVSGVTAAVSYRRHTCGAASRRNEFLRYGAWNYLRRRFVNIMVPYLFWGILLPVLSALVYGGSVDWRDEFYNMFVDNRLYWFLPALYGLIVSYMLYAAVYERIAGRIGRDAAAWREGLIVQSAAWIIVAAVFLALYLLAGYQLFRDMVGFMIPFAAAAVYVENGWVSRLAHRKAVVLSCAVLYAALIPLFDFDRISVFTSLLRMVLGLCMTVILLYAFADLRLPGILRKTLEFWGRSTLLIYILHAVIMERLRPLYDMAAERGEGVELTAYCLISVVICCLCAILAKGMEYVPVVRTLCLGKRK